MLGASLVWSSPVWSGLVWSRRACPFVRLMAGGLLPPWSQVALVQYPDPQTAQASGPGRAGQGRVQ